MKEYQLNKSTGEVEPVPEIEPLTPEQIEKIRKESGVDQNMEMDDYLIKTFISRLDKLGIIVTFAGNYPWIYFDTINGKKVTGTFRANHGWTAFFSPVEIHGKVKFSDRREVFKKVRSML